MAGTKRNTGIFLAIGAAGCVAGAGLAGIASSQAPQHGERARTIQAVVASTMAVQGIGAGGCYPQVSGIGRDILQSSAHASAATDWSNNAKALYGIGNQNNVANLQRPCEREGNSHAIRRWICTFTAQPCIAGGTSTTNPPSCHGVLAVAGDSAKFQSWAENRAIEQWQTAADNGHGAAYRTWTRAAGRDISCGHNGERPIRRRWTCTARGQPCR